MSRKSILPLILLLSGLLAFVSACGAPASASTSTSASGSTPAAATPTAPQVTATPGLTTQYAFTAQDSGKTVRYTPTTRFSISLNQQQYPQENIRVACEPQDVLGSITNAPYAAPPLYAVGYQTNEPGTCTIHNGDFTLTVIVVGNAITPTATPTQPAATPTQPTATSTPQAQAWKTYQGMAFTIRYPAGWFVNVMQLGPNGGIYTEEVEFRPSATSMVAFMVSALYNGEMLPETLLHNDPLYKSCTITSESKVTVNGITWSMATGQTQGPQLAPAQVTIAYANDRHPYRVAFSAPPAQFASYTKTFHTMFYSFQER